jgi:hypothetical protein
MWFAGDQVASLFATEKKLLVWVAVANAPAMEALGMQALGPRSADQSSERTGQQVLPDLGDNALEVGFRVQGCRAFGGIGVALRVWV